MVVVGSCCCAERMINVFKFSERWLLVGLSMDSVTFAGFHMSEMGVLCGGQACMCWLRVCSFFKDG